MADRFELVVSGDLENRPTGVRGSFYGGDMGPAQSLTLPGRYDQIQAFCEFVREAAEVVGFPESALFQLELACDEACTNVIEHAYGAEDQGQITVKWTYDNSEFKITISDQGRPFDPQSIVRPNIPSEPADWEALKVGGLGIHIMRKVMDSVIFSFDPKQGNVLVMIKHLPAGGAS